MRALPGRASSLLMLTAAGACIHRVGKQLCLQGVYNRLTADHELAFAWNMELLLTWKMKYKVRCSWNKTGSL